MNLIAFNTRYFGDFRDTAGQKYNLHDMYLVNNQFTKTPHIIAAAREYYACPDITVYPFSDDWISLQGEINWEQDILMNELMTPYVVVGQTYLSNLTAAFLKDTGWFTYINENFIENSTYGRNQGCEFVSTVLEKNFSN